MVSVNYFLFLNQIFSHFIDICENELMNINSQTIKATDFNEVPQAFIECIEACIFSGYVVYKNRVI